MEFLVYLGIFLRAFMCIHMDVGTFWVYFLPMWGHFGGNLEYFGGILLYLMGKFGDILGYLSVDLHEFGGICADFWAILMGF